MKALASSIVVSALLALSPVASAQQNLWDDALAAYETQHFGRALSLYEQLAGAGSAQAAEIAGAMLFYGETLYGAQVQQDRSRAALLLQRAARDGHPNAQFLLNSLSGAHAASAATGAASADFWSELNSFGTPARGD